MSEVGSSALKRKRKKLAVRMSLAAMAVGFLVAEFFVLAGFWSFSLQAFGWLFLLTVLVHGALWLVLHLRLDVYLTWDPHFVYVPWACVVALFCLFILVAPEARVLVPFGYFLNLLLIVGLVGFRAVLAFSFLMSSGYLAAIVFLHSRGEPLLVGYEAMMAFLLLTLGGFAGAVLSQAKRRKEKLSHNTTELLKFSRAVEQSPGLIIITDIDGQIEYVNPKFLATTGYSADEVIGKTPEILASGETSAEDYEKIWNQIASGVEWHGEFKNLKKDGTPYWVVGSISPIRDKEGLITHFISAQEDISERKHVEAQLVQAQKMEGVGQLVSGVAHDFNNLLTGVLGFADLALEKVDSDTPIRQELLEIQKAGESASALTRQLLAFGRRQFLRPIALDLNEVLDEVDALLRRTVSERVEIDRVLSQDLGQAFADPLQLQQILLNLASNAQDAMPRGGRMTIETANVELGARYGNEVVAVEPGPYVMLKVSDTGPGMDEDTRRRVFEPFFTTKERGRGTGLGLATVYGIVKQSRGYIWVSSEPGKGSSFEIYLPRLDESEASSPNRERERAMQLPEGTETVLLVEDDPLVRKLASTTLRRHGYRVHEADSPAKALSILNDGPLDLLITDVVMPGMDGVELAGRAKEAHPELKVLLISGYAEPAVLGERLADPGTHFLGKPFQIKRFLFTVRDILSG